MRDCTYSISEIALCSVPAGKEANDNDKGK